MPPAGLGVALCDVFLKVPVWDALLGFVERVQSEQGTWTNDKRAPLSDLMISYALVGCASLVAGAPKRVCINCWLCVRSCPGGFAVVVAVAGLCAHVSRFSVRRVLWDAFSDMFSLHVLECFAEVTFFT